MWWLLSDFVTQNKYPMAVGVILLDHFNMSIRLCDNSQVQSWDCTYFIREVCYLVYALNLFVPLINTSILKFLVHGGKGEGGGWGGEWELELG